MTNARRSACYLFYWVYHVMVCWQRGCQDGGAAAQVQGAACPGGRGQKARSQPW